MNHQPQVTLTIAERPADGAQLWDRHQGLLAIWGSICRLGSSQSINRCVKSCLILTNWGSSTGRRSNARTAN